MSTRRYFLGSLATLLGLSQLPAVGKLKLPRLDRRSALDLLLAGYQVQSVILSLCDVGLKLEGLPINYSSLSCRLHMMDIPAEEVVSTVKAYNVTLLDKARGVWVDCDDTTFTDVTGGEAGLLIAFQFTNGTSPVVSFLNDGKCFAGLPVTPNGGPIYVQMPASGLVRLS